mmetsp:Transcript_71087/g.154512  ORF Transcript_71087/g.154512 Transcript_71087/m.154512 type:complete len:219 (+) Transcript_71087:811-1467(+)
MAGPCWPQPTCRRSAPCPTCGRRLLVPMGPIWIRMRPCGMHWQRRARRVVARAVPSEEASATSGLRPSPSRPELRAKRTNQTWRLLNSLPAGWSGCQAPFLASGSTAQMPTRVACCRSRSVTSSPCGLGLSRSSGLTSLGRPGPTIGLLRPARSTSSLRNHFPARTWGVVSGLLGLRLLLRRWIVATPRWPMSPRVRTCLRPLRRCWLNRPCPSAAVH